MSKTVQTTFKTPEDKAREILERAARYEFDRVFLAISGGTDSVLSAYLAAELGPEYGIEPSAVIHANTGAGVAQTRLVAQVIAARYGIPFLEGNNRTLGERVFKHGWPAHTAPGHFFERIERKQDVFDAFVKGFDGKQAWISGARSSESKKRSANVPDSGIDVSSRNGKQIWISPLAGFTSEEKVEWFLREPLPVSEAYLFLGFSGECLACAYDDMGILSDLDLIQPNLAYVLRQITALLPVYHGLEETETEIAAKQLCWGWSPDEQLEEKSREQRSLNGSEVLLEAEDPIGCGSGSCGDRDVPEWIRELPTERIVDYADVLAVERGEAERVLERFTQA
jgi:3'-phosphoadenosine 5'-phosphosulfate sulfotransferase (PAPS reductase)/FAD synthetase